MSYISYVRQVSKILILLKLPNQYCSKWESSSRSR